MAQTTTTEFVLTDSATDPKTPGIGADYLKLKSMTFATTTTGHVATTTFTLQSNTAPPAFLRQIINEAARTINAPLYIEEYGVSTVNGVSHFAFEGKYTLLDPALTSYQHSGSSSAYTFTPARFEFTAAPSFALSTTTVTV